MAKRFFDTEIWEKEWFGELSVKQKALVFLLFSCCDCAGVYDPNYRMLKFLLGEKVTEDEILAIKQVIKLPNGKFFITDFITFQYGVVFENLNPSFSVHKGIIRILEKNGIIKEAPEIEEKQKDNNNNSFVTLTEGLEKSFVTLQDKDKDKDKDNKTIIEKKKKYGEFNNVLLSDKEVENLKELYKNDFNEAIGYLSAYIEAGGKKYRSHYAVLGKHNWVYKRVYEGRQGAIKVNKYTKKEIMQRAGEIF